MILSGRTALQPLLSAWLDARSISRGLPAPIAERGGFRVETGSDYETRRWIFAQDCAGLRQLGRELATPRQFLKLLAPSAALRAALDTRWTIEPESYFMRTEAAACGAAPLPDGYMLEQQVAGGVCAVWVMAPGGELAASGYAAETAEAYVYDRIVTEPGHMRKGLGTAVMRALGRMRINPGTPQLLVATDAGRRLYGTLGWKVISPYSTAGIPAAPFRPLLSPHSRERNPARGSTSRERSRRPR